MAHINAIFISPATHGSASFSETINCTPDFPPDAISEVVIMAMQKGKAARFDITQCSVLLNFSC
jgi:hypothetical protein